MLQSTMHISKKHEHTLVLAFQFWWSVSHAGCKSVFRFVAITPVYMLYSRRNSLNTQHDNTIHHAYYCSVVAVSVHISYVCHVAHTDETVCFSVFCQLHLPMTFHCSFFTVSLNKHDCNDDGKQLFL